MTVNQPPVHGLELSGVEPVDTLCPTSGEPCPALDFLARQYGDSVSPQVAESLPEYCQPRLDSSKLWFRQQEYAITARRIDCQGAEQEGNCPVRLTMDDNQLRRGIVGSLRKLFNRES